jgi:hypothetical protein
MRKVLYNPPACAARAGIRCVFWRPVPQLPAFACMYAVSREPNVPCPGSRVCVYVSAVPNGAENEFQRESANLATNPFLLVST